MSEILTQSALAERLVQKTGVSPEVAKRFASVFFTIVRTGLKSSDRFSIYNFGTFKKTWIETAEGLNPFTGEKMEIPAHWRIKFIPCPSVARRINRPYSHLKPKVIKEQKISDKGLLARASVIAQEEKSASDCTLLPEENTSSVQEPAVIEDDFYSSIPVSEPVRQEEIEDNNDNDDDDFDVQEDGGKKTWKFIAVLALGALLLALVISLLVKNCSSKKNRNPSASDGEPDVQESAFVEEAPENIVPPSSENSEIEEIEAAILFESYTVPQGAGYYKIAEERLGNRHLWPLLYEANKEISIDPDFIPVSADIKIPSVPQGAERDEKIASAVLDAYNAYLLMTEKEPDSPKNEERKNRAVRVIVSGELLCPGFIDLHQSRILPEYAQSARSIASRQYAVPSSSL
ncbi:HU family DNA-binding protein [Treponema porcinum]|uniref:HU family DNA-binding protein n=1 Tax=Treponema porcinum TaxID=261392 RepID=UPI002351FA74|nr:HU family DNA-binding protein [Treponema porcinum]MCI6721418.1 HU family DNA-binding protein [Treponema porcinum]MCI7114944.1 HU family DNA-binding protein [Treponema porcinum]